MTINARQDSSYLFNTSSGTKTNTSYGVSSLASLVSDYNTIKNGSYNKLVSAYYKKLGSDGDSQTSSTSSASTSKTTANHNTFLDEKLGLTKSGSAEASGTASEASKGYAKISSDASGVRDSLSALSSDKAVGNLFRERTVTTTDDEGNESTSWGIDKEAISSAVSKFVDSYNALLKSGADAESSTVTSRVSSLSKLAGSYSSQLKAIGINYDEKGVLTLDKDKLAAADTDAVKSVFNGVGSFGDKVDTAAMMIKSGATTAASQSTTYNSSGKTAATDVDYTSVWSASV